MFKCDFKMLIGATTKSPKNARHAVPLIKFKAKKWLLFVGR